MDGRIRNCGWSLFTNSALTRSHMFTIWLHNGDHTRAASCRTYTDQTFSCSLLKRISVLRCPRTVAIWLPGRDVGIEHGPVELNPFSIAYCLGTIRVSLRTAYHGHDPHGWTPSLITDWLASRTAAPFPRWVIVKRPTYHLCWLVALFVRATSK